MSKHQSCEHPLVEAIRRNPDDESLKIAYEQYLEESNTNSIQRELLRREREIAESYLDQAKLDRLIDEYERFRTDNSYYFWDYRGTLDHLFRSFNVWLISFNPARRFAIEQALQVRSGHNASDLNRLPIVVFRAGPIDARESRDQIVSFVKRYRGPSGKEPEVQPGELNLLIGPSWVRPTPAPV
jgi:hypothetical protein